MIIRSFDVSPDHTVTLAMGQMPPQAVRANTTIEIGGIAQTEPELVSFKEQTIVFSAGPAIQQGVITVTVSGRMPKSATSAEPYVTLEPDAENEDKAVIRSVYPATAKPGDAVTLRGQNLKNLTELYIGLSKVPTFTHTETSARFTVPRTVTPNTYPIRFKDGKFSGAVERSSARLEVTAAGEA